MLPSQFSSLLQRNYDLSSGFLRQLAKSGVGVEKVHFRPKQSKFGGHKMSRKLRKSFVGILAQRFFAQF
jgi:hypothetical protein